MGEESEQEEAPILRDYQTVRDLQCNDPTLSRALEAARNAKDSESPPHVMYKLIEGVLYRIGIDPKTQEVGDQMVVPQPLWREVMYLAQTITLAGHQK